MLKSGFFRLLNLHYAENSILLEEQKWSTKIEYNNDRKDDKHFLIKLGLLDEQNCYYIYPTFLKVLPLNWRNQKFNEATEVHISFPYERAVNETTFEGRVKSTLHYTIVYEDWSFHLFFDTNGVKIFTLVHYKNVPCSLTMDEHSFLKNAFQPHIQFLRKLFEQKAIFLSNVENELIEILNGVTGSINNVQKTRVSTLLKVKYQCTDHVATEKNEEEEKFEIFLSELRSNPQNLLSIQSAVNNNEQKIKTSSISQSHRYKSFPRNKVGKLRKKNIVLSGETSLITRINDFTYQLQKHFDSPSLEDIQKLLNRCWGKINLVEQYRSFLERLVDSVGKTDRETQQEQIRIIEYLHKKHINFQNVVFAFDNEKTFYHPTWHAECKLLGWLFLQGEIDLFNCFINLGLDPALEYVTYIVRYSGNNGIWEEMNKEYYDLVKDDSHEYEFSFLQRNVSKKLKDNEIRFKRSSNVSLSYQTTLTNEKFIPLPFLLYFDAKCNESLKKCIKTEDCSSLSIHAKTTILRQLSIDSSLHSSFKKYHSNLFDYIRIHCTIFHLQQNRTSHTNNIMHSICSEKRFQACPRLAVSDLETLCRFFDAFIENDEQLFRYNLFQAINQAMGFVNKPTLLKNRIMDWINFLVNCISIREENLLLVTCLCYIALHTDIVVPSFPHKEKILPGTIFLGGCLFAGSMFFSKQKTPIPNENSSYRVNKMA